jgi:hypothetical protein
MRASNSRKLSSPSKIPLCKHACDLEWVGDVIIAGSFAFWMERAVSVKNCSGQAVAQFGNRQPFLAEMHSIRAASAVAMFSLPAQTRAKNRSAGASERAGAGARTGARGRALFFMQNTGDFQTEPLPPGTTAAASLGGAKR